MEGKNAHLFVYHIWKGGVKGFFFFFNACSFIFLLFMDFKILGSVFTHERWEN